MSSADKILDAINRLEAAIHKNAAELSERMEAVERRLVEVEKKAEIVRCGQVREVREFPWNRLPSAKRAQVVKVYEHLRANKSSSVYNSCQRTFRADAEGFFRIRALVSYCYRAGIENYR